MYCAFFLTSISGTRHTSRKIVYKEKKKKLNAKSHNGTESVTSTIRMSKVASLLLSFNLFFFFSFKIIQSLSHAAGRRKNWLRSSYNFFFFFVLLAEKNIFKKARTADKGRMTSFFQIKWGKTRIKCLTRRALHSARIQSRFTLKGRVPQHSLPVIRLLF